MVESVDTPDLKICSKIKSHYAAYLSEENIDRISNYPIKIKTHLRVCWV